MAKILKKVFVPNTDQVSQSFTVQSWHVSQSVDAFTGTDDYDITISGSLDVTGPLDITGNSSVSGYSTVGNTTIYSTGNNLAIVDSALFTPSVDLGTLNNIRIGYAAGQGTAATIFSNMIGSSTGVSAQNASYSNFIGTGAGGFATFASGSNFIGQGAGGFAASASNSNLFGYNAGRGDIDSTIGPNNIVIGTNISLPYNYRNGINIGGILFGSGSYGTLSGNVFSGSVENGRIGINQPTPSFNLDVSGSGRFTNGLSLTGSLSTTGSVALRGLTTESKSFLVTIDNTTGQLFYTSSAGFISGAISPGGSNTQIQYNNVGTFAGTDRLTFDGTTLRATGSFSGSFTGIYNNLISLSNTSPTSEFQILYGNGTTASGSNNITINPATGSITTNTIRITGTGTTTTGSGVGQIYLNGGTSNLIEYNNVGVGAPTTGSRSPGTKIALWPALSTSASTDYAIGIEGNSMWHSVPFNNSTYFHLFYGGNKLVTSISGTGVISTTGNVIAFASDKRLKTNIKPIENPLDKVKSLNGFTYNWNDKAKSLANYDTEESLVGVFAQEIQEVLPEAVKLAPFDNDTTGNSISGENYLTVQYEKIVPLLIEAIKDQQKQIDELKSKIK
jgi:hypothetical protein